MSNNDTASEGIIATNQYRAKSGRFDFVRVNSEIRIESRSFAFKKTRSRYLYSFCDYNWAEFLSDDSPKLKLILLNLDNAEKPIASPHLNFLCEVFRKTLFHPFYGQIPSIEFKPERVQWIHMKKTISDWTQIQSQDEIVEFQPEWNGERCKGIKLLGEPSREVLKETLDAISRRDGNLSPIATILYDHLHKSPTPLFLEEDWNDGKINFSWKS